jgi:UDP-N-acetylmuramoylalanine--D-glutamate ligase
MIAARSFAKQAVGVFGLAGPDDAAVRALASGGASVFAWDDDAGLRTAAQRDGAVATPFGEWPWARIRALVLRADIPPTHPVVLAAQAASVEIIGELELFAREIRPQRDARGRAPVVAITGGSGKSTTAALIGHILSSCGFAAEVGGTIGKPALDFAPPNGRAVYVLEVACDQIDLSPGLIPDVAVLTDVTSDHPVPEDRAAAKATLLERTAKDGLVCIGVDDARSASICTRLSAGGGAETVPVSIGKVLGRGIFAIDGTLYDAQGQRATKVMDVSAAPHLAGAQDWRNAALAYAATKKLVKDSRAIARFIANFPGLAQPVARTAPKRQAS